MTYPILQLCARATAHPYQIDLLSRAVAGFSQWDDLIFEAEIHGLGPLLYHHLNTAGAPPHPDHFKRALKLLFLRHRRANIIRMKALREAVSILALKGINPLVLKGAALSHLIYPQIGLRPMRDIDILVPESDAHLTQQILVKCGYHPSTVPIPLDHFHLAPLKRTIDGLSVCVEVHHGLYPPCPPYNRQKTFDQLAGSAISFDVNGFSAQTLGYEDMLWHLYQHGFCMPLVYEPFRLISAADIITLVEEKVDVLNWDKIRSDYPKLLDVLPLFHHLTPWREKVLNQLAHKPGKAPKGVGQAFEGWPRYRLSDPKNKKNCKILRTTFFPPEWWFRVYYAISGTMGWYRHRLGTHPLHILWWMRLYGNHFYYFSLKAAGVDNAALNRSIFSKIQHGQIAVSALIRKLCK